MEFGVENKRIDFLDRSHILFNDFFVLSQKTEVQFVINGCFIPYEKLLSKE